LAGYLRHWRAGLAECRKPNDGRKQTMKFVGGEWKLFAAKVTA
jgi:hypothetical protein